MCNFSDLLGRWECPARAPATSNPQQIPPLGRSPSRTPKNQMRSQKKKKGELWRSVCRCPAAHSKPGDWIGYRARRGLYFPFQVKDKTSPPSVIAATGLITNNGSRAFGFGADLYLKQARYELKAGYGRGNLNYDLYGPGFINGNLGFKLPLVQTGEVFFIKLLRNVGWNIYVGPRFFTGDSFITLNPTNGNLPPIPPDVGLSTNLRSVGLEISRDSRKNRFYPVQGSVLDFTGDFSPMPLAASIRFSLINLLSISTPASGQNKFWPTTSICAEREASRPFTEIVSMAPTMSSAATLPGVISITTCSPHNWSTA